ncbi:chorismate-binding protein [Pseudonocardia sp. GCM10023141]|uniref:chorismate-binding protein n=1 Tax=Pseudonocardia sp. GCM10023141 TaxID=3252653 RepID=UPI00361D085B
MVAMRGIAEGEQRPHGVYCGAVGYLAPGPNTEARFSVAIRTVTHDPAHRYLRRTPRPRQLHRVHGGDPAHRPR